MRWPRHLLFLLWSAQALAQTPTAEEAIARFLSDPSMIPGQRTVGVPAPSFRSADLIYEVALADPQAMAVRGMLFFDPQHGRVRAFDAVMPALVPAVGHSADDAKAAALAYAQRRWQPWRDCYDHISVSRPQSRREGRWFMSVTGWRGPLELPLSLDVGINAWDLTLGSVAVQKEEPVTAELSVRVTPAEAEAVMRAELLAAGARVRSEGTMGYWLSRVEGRQYYCYNKRFLVEQTKDGQVRLAMALWQVDVHTGRTVRHDLTQAAATDTPDPVPYAGPVPWLVDNEFLCPLTDDSMPCWVTCGGRLMIAFMSNRSRYGVPRYMRERTTAFLADPLSGQLLCARQNAQAHLRQMGASAHWLAFLAGGVRVLDLTTGAEIQATNSARPGDQAALSPSGRRLAVVADRQRGRPEVYVGEVTPDGFAAQRRPVALAAAQVSPVFGGDDDTLFFFTLDEGSARFDWYRIKVPEQWEGAKAECVSKDVGEPRRVTVSADGRVLVLWTGSKAWLCDARSGVRHDVTPKDLRDPDRPSQWLTEIADVAVSPDGNQMAFSAQSAMAEPPRWDPQTARLVARAAGRRIYVRNLDGTGLKRVTPLEDVVVPPYVFPANGKPAFEVPEEFAKPYVMPN